MIFRFSEKEGLSPLFLFALTPVLVAESGYISIFAQQHDTQRLFLCMSGSLVWLSIALTRQVKVGAIDFLLLVLFILGWLMAFLLDQPLKMSLGILIVLTAFIFKIKNLEKEVIKIIFLIMITCASLHCLRVFSIVGMGIWFKQTISLGDLAQNYTNYRFLNHVQTIWIPLLVGSFFYFEHRKIKILALCLAIIHFGLVVQLGGRATLFALTAATLLGGCFFSKRAILWLKLYLWIFLLGVLLKFLIFNLLAQPLGLVSETSRLVERLKIYNQFNEPRFLLWERAWVGIQESPWLGNGPMSFSSIEMLRRDTALSPTLEGIGIHGAHPHSIYLQIAYEWGIPAAVFFIFCIIYLIYILINRIRRVTNSKDFFLGLSLTSAVIAVSIDGFFSGNFVMPVSQLWIVLLLAASLIWSRDNQKVIAFEKAQIPWGLISYRYCCVIAAGISIVILFPEFMYLDAHLKYIYTQIAPTGISNPRFWSHGWF